MFSSFFINRPIFATVLALLIMFAGILTLTTLPVAQFPKIAPPTVSISASYPGADAQTVAQTVGIPIEAQVNGIEGMLYMSSTSSNDGSYNLTITFDNDVDVDIAAIDVQNRLAEIQGTLPTAVTQQGLSTRKESTNIVLFVAITGDSAHRYDALYLDNYARINLIDELTRVSGVGGVSVFGAGNYSMRVWLDADMMNIRNITPQEVYEAITAQNIEVATGSIGAPPGDSNNAFQFTLTTQSRLSTPTQFGDIIIRTDSDGSILRLKDIARVDLGSIDYGTIATASGTQAAMLGIKQLPDANALDVSKNVRAKLRELEPYFPEGIKYEILMDTTEFVTASIHDVLITLLETIVIVMLVIMLFLQNRRAVIIPMLTIPVSLIGTFSIMGILGFSINTLTLFGLVLAIAIVVDDAIIVVENYTRLITADSSDPKAAALQSMKELTGPIIGEVLVLMSVFIPTAFVSGITGELYKQFALTIAVSTAISGFVALTLTPALCAIFITNISPNNAVIYRAFNKLFKALIESYNAAIQYLLKHQAIAIGAFILLTLAAFISYRLAPTSYIPAEDSGYFITSIQLPDNASLERTNRVTMQAMKLAFTLPEVENVITTSGYSMMGGGAASNMATLFVMLKPWSQRKGSEESVFDVIRKFDALTASIQEAEIFSVNPPAIAGLGNSSGLEMELLDINNLGSDAIAEAISAIIDAADKDKSIASVTTLYQGAVPQYTLNIDRNRAEMLGLDISDIYSAITYYIGGAYVNDFVDFGRVWQVKVQAGANYRSTIDELEKINVRNSTGEMVPLGSFARIAPSMGESMINRYNMYHTASLTFNPAKGVSSSTDITTAEDIVTGSVGNRFGYAWTGEAYQETEAGVTISFVFLFAIIMTLLVLAAQYESWRSPIAVVLSMPIAILGTIVGCTIMGQSISLYTQIGLILLLGLSAKNAILIVEYATQYRKAGNDITQAALKAGNVRFRPIIMTTCAFIFGVMPMLYAHGAGAESRISLGSAVVFGMALNAIFGTLLVPNFFKLVQTIRCKKSLHPNPK